MLPIFPGHRSHSKVDVHASQRASQDHLPEGHAGAEGRQQLHLHRGQPLAKTGAGPASATVTSDETVASRKAGGEKFVAVVSLAFRVRFNDEAELIDIEASGNRYKVTPLVVARSGRFASRIT